MHMQAIGTISILWCLESEHGAWPWLTTSADMRRNKNLPFISSHDRLSFDWTESSIYFRRTPYIPGVSGLCRVCEQFLIIAMCAVANFIDLAAVQPTYIIQINKSLDALYTVRKSSICTCRTGPSVYCVHMLHYVMHRHEHRRTFQPQIISSAHWNARRTDERRYETKTAIINGNCIGKLTYITLSNLNRGEPRDKKLCLATNILICMIVIDNTIKYKR